MDKCPGGICPWGKCRGGGGGCYVLERFPIVLTLSFNTSAGFGCFEKLFFYFFY